MSEEETQKTFKRRREEVVTSNFANISSSSESREFIDEDTSWNPHISRTIPNSSFQNLQSPHNYTPLLSFPLSYSPQNFLNSPQNSQLPWQLPLSTLESSNYTNPGSKLVITILSYNIPFRILPWITSTK